jgi:two-component system response regulator PilR (NtrC family)
MLTLLFIDDDEKEIAILSQVLTSYFVIGCSTGAEGMKKLREVHVDLVILDLNLPDMDGFAVLEHLGKIGDQTPVIILSAYGYPDNVVRAVRLGASDFVQKPYQLPHLRGTIERTILQEETRTTMNNRPASRSTPEQTSQSVSEPADSDPVSRPASESEATTKPGPDGRPISRPNTGPETGAGPDAGPAGETIAGPGDVPDTGPAAGAGPLQPSGQASESCEGELDALRDYPVDSAETCEPLSHYGEVSLRHGEDPDDPLRRFVGTSRRVYMLKTYTRMYADNTEPVLLVGESGTGKDVLARAIHDISARRRGPYIALNAGAIPEGIIESELFGTEQGAFTGAVPRRGYFEQADGGTLFLDEIGEMPLSSQVKMLRILEDGSVLRVGGRRRSFVDVRIICATNRPLEKMVAKGSFRKDLFYRINTLTLPIPPLKQRKEDIPELALLFFEEMGVPPSRVRRSSIAKMLSYEWPGNTRELKNTIKRAVVLAANRVVEPDHIFFSAIPFDVE